MPPDCLALAEALGDTPFTAISAHVLRRGLGDAYLLGDLAADWGAIVRDRHAPDEPAAVGNDAGMMWSILQSLDGWFCVNVASEMARPLGQWMERIDGYRVRYYDDIHYTLTVPVEPIEHKLVRRFTTDDLALLETAPEGVRPMGFGEPRLVLEHGFAAGATADGQVVAVAQTYARSERYADIGVFTLPEYRGRRFATAAASIVARCVQEAGQTPVWSTGEDNFASRRVAEKLGFKEAGRRVYMIVEEKAEPPRGQERQDRGNIRSRGIEPNA